MTLGIIVGIVVAVVATILLILNDLPCDADDVSNHIIEGIVVGLVCWVITSVIGATYIKNKYGDDYLVTISEEKQLVSGAKIEAASRSGTVYFIYTLKNSNTDKMQVDFVNIIDTDTDEPYLLVKKVGSKDHFLSHLYDDTVYEYYGRTSDLYK